MILQQHYSMLLQPLCMHCGPCQFFPNHSMKKIQSLNLTVCVSFSWPKISFPLCNYPGMQMEWQRTWWRPGRRYFVSTPRKVYLRSMYSWLHLEKKADICRMCGHKDKWGSSMLVSCNDALPGNGGDKWNVMSRTHTLAHRKGGSVFSPQQKYRRDNTNGIVQWHWLGTTCLAVPGQEGNFVQFWMWMSK